MLASQTRTGTRRHQGLEVSVSRAAGLEGVRKELDGSQVLVQSVDIDDFRGFLDAKIWLWPSEGGRNVTGHEVSQKKPMWLGLQSSVRPLF